MALRPEHVPTTLGLLLLPQRPRQTGLGPALSTLGTEAKEASAQWACRGGPLTLAMEMVCCSMASWIATRSSSRI